MNWDTGEEDGTGWGGLAPDKEDPPEPPVQHDLSRDDLLHELREAVEILTEFAAHGDCSCEGMFALSPDSSSICEVCQARRFVTRSQLPPEISGKAPLVTCWNCPQALLPHWKFCHMCGATQIMRGQPPATVRPTERLTSEHAPDLIVHYPDKLRDRIGMFMLRHGVKMGVAVDPSVVQDLIEQWEREAHPGLEHERDQWRKLAQDALNTTLPSPILLDVRPGGEGQCTGCEKLTNYLCPFCKIKRGSVVWLCELAECRDRHEEAGCARTPHVG